MSSSNTMSLFGRDVDTGVILRILSFLNVDDLQQVAQTSEKMRQCVDLIQDEVKLQEERQFALGHLNTMFTNVGYREGLDSTEDSLLQHGFNEGFIDSAASQLEVGVLRGVTTAMSLFLMKYPQLKGTLYQCLKKAQGEPQLPESSPSTSQRISISSVQPTSSPSSTSSLPSSDNSDSASSFFPRLALVTARLDALSRQLDEPSELISLTSKSTAEECIQVRNSRPGVPFIETETLKQLCEVSSSATTTSSSSTPTPVIKRRGVVKKVNPEIKPEVRVEEKESVVPIQVSQNIAKDNQVNTTSSSLSSSSTSSSSSAPPSTSTSPSIHVDDTSSAITPAQWRTLTPPLPPSWLKEVKSLVSQVATSVTSSSPTKVVSNNTDTQSETTSSSSTSPPTSSSFTSSSTSSSSPSSSSSSSSPSPLLNLIDSSVKTHREGADRALSSLSKEADKLLSLARRGILPARNKGLTGEIDVSAAIGAEGLAGNAGGMIDMTRTSTRTSQRERKGRGRGRRANESDQRDDEGVKEEEEEEQESNPLEGVDFM